MNVMLVCFSFSISYFSCKCCCSSLHYIMFRVRTTGFVWRTLRERLVYLCDYLYIVIVVIIHCYREENTSYWQ
jgi:hypothetical protein